MYLAPLNYDRFFKKVFSDLKIAKAFLEAFLDIKIESIERIKEKHKITDDAAFVEFDFRCKVRGQYIIIDMQQWYKAFVVNSFTFFMLLKKKCCSSALLFSFCQKFIFMKKTCILLLILMLILRGGVDAQNTTETINLSTQNPIEKAGWTYIWGDEFDSDTLNWLRLKK